MGENQGFFCARATERALFPSVFVTRGGGTLGEMVPLRGGFFFSVLLVLPAGRDYLVRAEIERQRSAMFGLLLERVHRREIAPSALSRRPVRICELGAVVGVRSPPVGLALLCKLQKVELKGNFDVLDFDGVNGNYHVDRFDTFDAKLWAYFLDH